MNSDITYSTTNLTASITATISSRIPEDVANHMQNTSNPHEVTCEQIGAMPYNDNIVIDSEYNHTDNNFTNEYKAQINELSDDHVSTSDITSVSLTIAKNSSDIDDINTNIANISQEITEIQTVQNNTTATLNTQNKSISDIQANISTIETNLSETQTKISDTETEINAVNIQINNLTLNKVDKIEGKGLSEENFTSELKNKLENIPEGGYSANTTTITACNTNFFYNPAFEVNTRNSNSYLASSLGEVYTVDRWIKDEYTNVTVISGGGITIANTSTTDRQGIGQFIPYPHNILGKKVTFTINTSKGLYSFTTSTTLPTNPEITSRYTVLDTMATDFGLLQIEYRGSHFLFRILLEPTTDTLDIYFAKLELGENYSGFERPDIISERVRCYGFYQTVDSHSVYVSSYCQRNATTSNYFVYWQTFSPMYKQPTLINNISTSKLQFAENDKAQNIYTFDSISIPMKSKDNRTFGINIKIAEDNSGMLGSDNIRIYWTGIKLYNLALDAEIKD